MAALSPIHIVTFAWLSLAPIIICTQSFNLNHQPTTTMRGNMQLLQQQQHNRKQHMIINNQQCRKRLSTTSIHMSSVDENIDAKEIEKNSIQQPEDDNSIREKIIQEKVELINELNDAIETQPAKLNELIEENQSAEPVEKIIDEVEIRNENNDDDDIQIIIDDDDSSSLILVVPSLSKQDTTNNTTLLLSSSGSKRSRRKQKKNNPRMQMFAYLSQPSKFYAHIIYEVL